ncbi:MAG: hydrogenase maturation protease [Ignavibacteriales bacterium]|nr:hydrogenase maturation protease [Ignavibacteriales bacterium]
MNSARQDELLAPILIIGVGTDYRRDDRIGLLIARKIRDLHIPNVTVEEQSGDGVALMDAWIYAETVIVIDAVRSKSAPGTIFRFDAHTQSIPSDFFYYSTHEFNVAEAVELARALHELPTQLIVYGIEGADFEMGGEISEEVRKAAEQVISSIQTDITSISMFDETGTTNL